MKKMSLNLNPDSKCVTQHWSYQTQNNYKLFFFLSSHIFMIKRRYFFTKIIDSKRVKIYFITKNMIFLIFLIGRFPLK